MYGSQIYPSYPPHLTYPVFDPYPHNDMVGHPTHPSYHMYNVPHNKGLYRYQNSTATTSININGPYMQQRYRDKYKNISKKEVYLDPAKGQMRLTIKTITTIRTIRTIEN